MHRKFVLLTGTSLVALLFGAQASLASPTDTQNVTFTVSKAVAIVSTGNQTIASAIDPSSGTPTGSATGGLTVSSNDASGRN